MNVRSFFHLCAIFFWIRCRKKNSASLALDEKTPKKEELKTKIEDQPQKEVLTSKSVIWDEAPIDIQESCQVKKNIDLSALQPVPEQLKPVWKLYGSKERALLGLSFPGYVRDPLSIKSIMICNEDGLPLMQKGLDPILDFMPSGLIKALAFDGLDLTSSQKICFVFFTISGSGFLWNEMKHLSFLDSLNGQPVIDHPRCHWPIVPIAEQVIFADQPFYSIETVSQIENAFSFKESMITDISGTVISPFGQEFKKIFDFPLFVCYQPESDFFKRSIYWMG